MIEKHEKDSNDFYVYEYDIRNRLTKVKHMTFTHTFQTYSVVEYEYDLFNRRISKKVDDNTVNNDDKFESYVYDIPGSYEDGDNIIYRFVDKNDDGKIYGSELNNRYFFGHGVDKILADEEVGDRHPDGSFKEGDVIWALTDHIGSVRDLVSYDAGDDKITLEAHIKYNAFGEIISETDADDNAVTDNDHIFGFTARERDNESTLNYYRNRYYDPTTGRFLTADPIEDDFENSYRYVNNNPVNRTDPSGLADRPGLTGTIKQKGNTLNYHPYQIHRLGYAHPSLVGTVAGPVTTIGERYKAGSASMVKLHGHNRKYHITSDGFDLMMKHKYISGRTGKQVQASIDKYAPLFDSPRVIVPGSKSIGFHFDGTTNHLGHITNVTKAYSLYQGTKFYLGGVGNYADFNELYTSGGAGRGFQAIIDRALAAFDQYGQGKEVHVFGFSRGAAQSIEFARALGKKNIKVRLWLFDPVYSRGLPGQDSMNIKANDETVKQNSVNITLPSNVINTSVFYARDEERSWFPATHFANAHGLTNFEAFVIPGRHGDIGGHYMNNAHIHRFTLSAMLHSQGGYLLKNGFFKSGAAIDPYVTSILQHSELGNLMKLREGSGYSEEAFSRIVNNFDLLKETFTPFYSQQAFVAAANSNNRADWKSGPSGIQFKRNFSNPTGLNSAWILGKAINLLTLGEANLRQPMFDKYNRNFTYAPGVKPITSFPGVHGGWNNLPPIPPPQQSHEWMRYWHP